MENMSLYCPIVKRYMLFRKLGEERLLVVCNFTDNEVEFEVPEEFKE